MLSFAVNGVVSNAMLVEYQIASWRPVPTEQAVQDMCENTVPTARFRAPVPKSLRETKAGQTLTVLFWRTGLPVEQAGPVIIPGVGEVISSPARIPPPPAEAPPPPPAAVTDHDVTGYVDNAEIVDGTVRIRGWACMMKDEAQIEVHLYVGASAFDGGEMIASARANLPAEPAIAKACGINGLNHRFEFTLDAATAARTASRSIYVHGLSTYGNPNLKLKNSGLYMIAPIPSVINELTYSSAGPIAGRTCVQLSEPSDPDSWSDNYLCSVRDLGLRWSSAGPIGGMTCVQINEPADPNTWDDNYLCSPATLGFKWSFAGPIFGKRCIQIHEAADPHTWMDNYLCGP